MTTEDDFQQFEVSLDSKASSVSTSISGDVLELVRADFTELASLENSEAAQRQMLRSLQQLIADHSNSSITLADLREFKQTSFGCSHAWGCNCWRKGQM